MDQLSFASLAYAAKKKRTKRDVFLAEMAAVVPWVALEAVIEPHYPKAGPNGGRRPFPLAVMLRIYCLQQWYNLSDPRRGRSALRHLLDARVRRSGARTRRNSRRDDHLELPASAGAPRVDEGGIRRCFGASGGPRCAAAWRHHRRCDADRGIPVDEERSAKARSRDALIEEGQPVVLWHEGTHRRRCQERARTYGGRDHGQRA